MRVFKIFSAVVDKCLSISGSDFTAASLTNNQNVVLMADNGSLAQQWIIPGLKTGVIARSALNASFGLNVYRVGDPYNCDIHTVAGNESDATINFVSVFGGFNIVLANYNLYLTASSTSEGANVYWAEANGTGGQVWTYERVQSSATVYAAPYSSLTSAQQITNAEYIEDYLMARGFTRNAACGVLGNFYAESYCNPGRWEDDHFQEIRGGYGLAQWTNAEGGPNSFLEYAASIELISSTAAVEELDALASNDPKVLMDAELDHLIATMHPSRRMFYYNDNYDNSGYTNIKFSSFVTSTLPAGTLAVIFHDYYERSNATAATIQTYRAIPASNFYNTGEFE